MGLADLAGEPGQQHPARERGRQQQAEHGSGEGRIARAHDPERRREDAGERGADPRDSQHRERRVPARGEQRRAGRRGHRAQDQQAGAVHAQRRSAQHEPRQHQRGPVAGERPRSSPDGEAILAHEERGHVAAGHELVAGLEEQQRREQQHERLAQEAQDLAESQVPLVLRPWQRDERVASRDGQAQQSGGQQDRGQVGRREQQSDRERDEERADAEEDAEQVERGAPRFRRLVQVGHERVARAVEGTPAEAEQGDAPGERLVVPCERHGQQARAREHGTDHERRLHPEAVHHRSEAQAAHQDARVHHQEQRAGLREVDADPGGERRQDRPEQGHHDAEEKVAGVCGTRPGRSRQPLAAALTARPARRAFARRPRTPPGCGRGGRPRRSERRRSSSG